MKRTIHICSLTVNHLLNNDNMEFLGYMSYLSFKIPVRN